MEINFNIETQSDKRIWQLVIHKEDGKGNAWEGSYMVTDGDGQVTSMGSRAFTSVVPAKRWLSTVLGHDPKWSATKDKQKLVAMAETSVIVDIPAV